MPNKQICSNRDCRAPIRNSVDAICEKCGTSAYDQKIDLLHIIDIAHSREDVYDAEQKILNAISYAQINGFKGVKIIHGFGSQRGHSSVIRDHSVRFLQDYSRRNKTKLTKDNQTPGAHILYF